LADFDGNSKIKWVKNKKSAHFRADFCLAGATGIAPSASNFGGTDFHATQRLERL
jgi:hypothetical protein